MRRRAGVVLTDGDSVALIRRDRIGQRYYVVPGGGVEPGETDADAAVREAFEELGVEVVCERVLAEVTFRDSVQIYFTARIVGGAFGTGQGAELDSTIGSPFGSYTPEWVPFADLEGLDARPAVLLSLLAAGPLPDEPLRLSE
jgi:8-oxo-dGTP diphosphatase